MVSLREMILADVADVFLQDDEFATVDEYTPAGDVARSVIGVAEELVDADLDETGDEVHTERIRYWCSRLEADDGIETPLIGDTLLLSSDPDGQLYTFTGDIPERDDAAWWLIFARPRRTARGTKVNVSRAERQ